MVAGWLVIWGLAADEVAPARLLVESAVLFLATALTVALAMFLVFGRRGRYRLFGFQWLEGYRWMWVMPAVLLGAVAGGAWLFWPMSFAGFLPGPRGLASWLTLLGFPFLAEILFRGLAHGIMVGTFSVQHAEGRWFLSWPVTVSALLYALWTLPFLPFTLAGTLWPLASLLSVPLGAAVVGVGLGIARERSGGLLAPLALHYLAVLVVAITGAILR
jgi:membrane protease YdiL (CAAX protease family)